jgi:hypothetical protein
MFYKGSLDFFNVQKGGHSVFFNYSIKEFSIAIIFLKIFTQ